MTQSNVEEMVTVTIDGYEVSVPKGTLVIRAAEQLGIKIPRFCDHPLLEPAGACRQCLVEVATPDPRAGGAVRAMPKPQASCTIPVTPGMVVQTQVTSDTARRAQQGMLEFLLVNHPLDCPICDKGGECPLQNQAMSDGRPEGRFDGTKRTYRKPISISAQILLDRERCVLCQRCTRFSEQIAGDPFIDLQERGANSQIGAAADQPYQSYFSGNVVQICPVGALTSAAYRFRARPFDLVSANTACEHCASGCALRTDARRSVVTRRLAGRDLAVNEEWNCDKGRFAYTYANAADRLTVPMVRDEHGDLVPTSWPEAIDIAARGLAGACESGVGVLTGGRLTVEDSYAYAKFARVALGTNDIDFRARPLSGEETSWLTSRIAGRPTEVTYADLEQAGTVVLVAFEPEEESPIVFLRLRKASRRRGTQVISIAPFATHSLGKMSGHLLRVTPGDEAAAIDAWASGEGDFAARAMIEGLRAPKSVILVGERALATPGLLGSVARLAAATGAKLAWIPRRAGDRGALEAGAFPTLLPGGRSVTDAAARADVAAAWGVPRLPDQPGRDASAILQDLRTANLGGLVIAGVDVADFADPAAAREAIERAGFVVSLEQRPSEVTELADVVFPVAADAEAAGSYMNWEGRARTFEPAVPGSRMLSDQRVLNLIARSMGVDLGLATVEAARAEFAQFEPWDGDRPRFAPAAAVTAPAAGAGEAVLATWATLLDAGRMQFGEPHLAETRPRAVARISAATAAEVGVADGDLLVVASERGRVELPVAITDMHDRVVWVPTNAPESATRQALAVGAGSVVRIHAGGAA